MPCAGPTAGRAGQPGALTVLGELSSEGGWPAAPQIVGSLRLGPHGRRVPQHLATFIMDKSEAIVTVDDAIRKLVHLSAKEKIWTQEVLLQVNEKELRLLDVESKVRAGPAGSGKGEGGPPGHLWTLGTGPSPRPCRRSWRTSRCPPCSTARRCSTSCATRRCCCSCARTRSRASPTCTSSTATRWR